MFTFSFNTAFADVSNTDKAVVLAKAKAVAEKIVADNYDAAMKLVAADNLGYTEADKTETANAWAKIDVKADVLAKINELYVAEAANCANYDADVNKYAAKVFKLTGGSHTGVLSLTQENGTTFNNQVEQLKEFIFALDGLQAVYNMYEADRADVYSAYDKIDWSAYSTDVNPADKDGRTYLEIAKDIIAEAKEAAKTYKTWELTEYTWESPTILISALNDVKSAVANVVTAQKITVGTEQYPTGLYLVNNVPTKDRVDSDGAVSSADIAKKKAAAAAAYAQFISARGAVEPYKSFADAWLKVVNFLAEEKMLTLDPSYNETSVALNDGTGAATDSTVKTTYVDAVEEIEGLKAFAEKYKAERDATGALVRDAKEVDDIVKEYTAYLYGTTHKVATTGKDTYKTLDDAQKAIIAATIKADAQEVAFAKEVAKSKLADDLADIEDNYYALELAIVKNNYEAALAKVEAATTAPKVKAAYDAVDLTKGAKDTDAVDALLNFTNATPENIAKKAVDSYITYVNSALTILDDNYIVGKNDVVEELKTVYGESGARTAAERKAVAIDAAEIAGKLSTVGKLNAAKAAAEEAIKALPSTITVAEKDAVVNAYNLVADYNDLTGHGVIENQAKLDAAVNTLVAELRVDLAKKISAVDKADKTALRELSDEIAAANKLIVKKFKKAENLKVNTSVVEDALDVIRGKELAAVKAAINAIPVNVTEADKAVVEAARKAYDEFVKDWTRYNEFGINDYNAAAHVTNFRTLALAEATLGLSVGDPALKVKSMKLRAYSKYAKKGITVKWVIEDGRKSDAKGYQVWRSTKANSGYKKLITVNPSYGVVNAKNLKKGVTYYYKVRAYNRTADGKLVFSDWSNKAYRKAK